MKKTKEILQSIDNTTLVAGLLMFVDEIMSDYPEDVFATMDKHGDAWPTDYINNITEWQGMEHHHNVPMTCSVCVAEEYIARAERVVESAQNYLDELILKLEIEYGS